MQKKPLTVPCPTCQKPSLFTIENSSRPFCSERCKLIDLGAWADEQQRVPGEAQHLSTHSDEGES